MRYRLIRTSLFYAFLLVFALDVLAATVKGPAGAILYYLGIGYLMMPGIWLVYGLFDVNNHDLLPLVMAELVNLLIYWVFFIPLLALLWRRKRGRPRGGVPGEDPTAA